MYTQKRRVRWFSDVPKQYIKYLVKEIVQKLVRRKQGQECNGTSLRE